MGWIGKPSPEDERARALAESLGQTDAGMGWSPQDQDATMRGIRPMTWEYKPGAQAALGLPAGRHGGPMAQNLEKTPMGRGMVVDTPQGKVIDQRVAVPGILNMIGRIGERLDHVEGDKPRGSMRDWMQGG